MARRMSPPSMSQKMGSLGPNEFYTGIGRLAVAWGQLEGTFAVLAAEILSLPSASKLRRQIKLLPTNWADRKRLWKGAFGSLPELAPMQAAAHSFIQRVMAKTYSRRLLAEAMWDNFIPSEQPAITAHRVHSKKQDIYVFDLEPLTIPLSALVKDAEDVEVLNMELANFADFIRQIGAAAKY